MTLQDALATQPAWVQVWVFWLVIGAFVLPLGLLIWRRTRIAGIATIAASVVAGMSVDWIFGQLGYVRLLGLPHIVFWTPVAIYLFLLQRDPGVPARAALLIRVILATITISLAFDVTDVLRYALGDRAPY